MKILIVDDERNIRLTLKNILEDKGYITVAVPSGEEALKHFSIDNFGLIILDVKLPGMDGIKTLKAIRKAGPDQVVIMISGHSGIETAVEAVKLGAYDFLEKPLAMAKILTVTRNIVERNMLINRVDLEGSEKNSTYQLIGSSPQMQQLHRLIKAVARTNSKVLIRGESGTGKELVAYSLHHQSPRKEGPFIKFNSAAIPDELVESELFGYEKGAFTGADKRKLGKLELADGGTLFLDEIGDMNLKAQAKVLRVIQDGTLERVGGSETIKIDVRILAATNKPLEVMVKNGSFREDLFYRLNVVPLELPPLRERTGDIALLVNHYLRYFSNELKLNLKSFTDSALKRLDHYPFPGNVRELRNLIERLYILISEDWITDEVIKPHLISNQTPFSDYPFLKTQSLSDAKRAFEIHYLTDHLKRHNWKISEVSRILGIHQPNLSKKIKDLGIKR
ncbi:sigma-54-dependent Fis family transcriptional regulator [Caldithrix abyssi]|nr:sigma-54-dependent Fis family transcriptional regulator [Caldithrix abyssi]